jgi:homoserine kinase
MPPSTPAPHSSGASTSRRNRFASDAAIVARAPGGIGNIGPGLDVLGCAVTGLYDQVHAQRATSPGVLVLDSGDPELPRDAHAHASAIAAVGILELADARDFGIELRVRKGLPLAGGQGGSAASAVAGAAAANVLLGEPLDAMGVLRAALDAEAHVAGRHADNVAPALLGGIVLVHALDPLDIVRIPYPASLRVVLVHPAQRLRTADARAVLPRTLERTIAMRQAAHVAAMVAAFASGDLDLLRRALHDEIAEPARAPLLTGFAEARDAALTAGALGCSISGAGPTSFAFAADDATALGIATAMIDAYASCGVQASSRVAQIDDQGVQVERAGRIEHEERA